MSLFRMIFRDTASFEEKVSLNGEGPVDRAARGVATRFTRGNVAVQNGKMLTEERMERERDELRRSLRVPS